MKYLTIILTLLISFTFIGMDSLNQSEVNAQINSESVETDGDNQHSSKYKCNKEGEGSDSCKRSKNKNCKSLKGHNCNEDGNKCEKCEDCKCTCKKDCKKEHRCDENGEKCKMCDQCECKCECKKDCNKAKIHKCTENCKDRKCSSVEDNE